MMFIGKLKEALLLGSIIGLPILAIVTLLLVVPQWKLNTKDNAAESAAIANSDKPVELFRTSDTCGACHQGITDQAGNDISFLADWQASMMANSSRDPYWRASVAHEVKGSPEYADAIQDKCATCHTPAARTTNHAMGEMTTLLGDQGVLQETNPQHPLAIDGITCSLCHQIPANLAEQLRQNGNTAIDTFTAIGERAIYGPFEISPENIALMQGSSGFIPTQSDHIRESTLCATCHELHLNYVQADGTLSEGNDLFYEQTLYSEWLASDYVNEASCQSCHMLAVEGNAPISNVALQNEYSNIARHTFTGANVFMLTIFKEYGNELGVRAEASQFEENIARTLDLLQNETVNLSLSPIQLTDNGLQFDVTIESLAGHKFPTAFPSRRAWLHVTVLDAQGNIIFESGGYERLGNIIGNDNDADKTTYEPHYDLITVPDQVQIYEPVMQNVYGEVTTYQIRSSGYIKDNRLLPLGFNKMQASEVVAVIGQAQVDDDFIGGSDTVTYQVATMGAKGPFTVDVELLYQSVGYRWAQNVLDSQTQEGEQFRAYYEGMGNIPVIVAKVVKER